MDMVNKQKFWMGVIVVLVLLNVGLMAFIWFNRMPPRGGHPPGGMPPDGPRGGDFMTQELGLRPEQAQMVRALHEQQALRSDTVKAELSRLYGEIVEELFLPEPDTGRIRLLSEAIGDQQTRFELRSFESFFEIKKICDPDQQAKLKLLLTEMFTRSLPPPHIDLDRPAFQRPPPDMPAMGSPSDDPRAKDRRGP